MRLISGVTLLVLLMNAGTVQAKENMAQAAARISKARTKIAELQKSDPKVGQPAVSVENLSIDDFLLMDAVPEGVDVLNADSLYHAEQNYKKMSKKQALLAIRMMRDNGLEFDKDLEDKIEKDPERMSELMNETFSAMKGKTEFSEKENKAARHRAMRRAEHFLGIKFQSLLERQKKKMTANNK